MSVVEDGVVEVTLDLGEDDGGVGLVLDDLDGGVLEVQGQDPGLDVGGGTLEQAVRRVVLVVVAGQVGDLYVLDQRGQRARVEMLEDVLLQRFAVVGLWFGLHQGII